MQIKKSSINHYHYNDNTSGAILRSDHLNEWRELMEKYLYSLRYVHNQAHVEIIGTKRKRQNSKKYKWLDKEVAN